MGEVSIISPISPIDLNPKVSDIDLIKSSSIKEMNELRVIMNLNTDQKQPIKAQNEMGKFVGGNTVTDVLKSSSTFGDGSAVKKMATDNQQSIKPDKIALKKSSSIFGDGLSVMNSNNYEDEEEEEEEEATAATTWINNEGGGNRDEDEGVIRDDKERLRSNAGQGQYYDYNNELSTDVQWKADNDIHNSVSGIISQGSIGYYKQQQQEQSRHGSQNQQGYFQNGLNKQQQQQGYLRQQFRPGSQDKPGYLDHINIKEEEAQDHSDYTKSRIMQKMPLYYQNAGSLTPGRLLALPKVVEESESFARRELAYIPSYMDCSGNHGARSAPHALNAAAISGFGSASAPNRSSTRGRFFWRRFYSEPRGGRHGYGDDVEMARRAASRRFRKSAPKSVASTLLWPLLKLRDGYVGCMMGIDGAGDFSGGAFGATYGGRYFEPRHERTLFD